MSTNRPSPQPNLKGSVVAAALCFPEIGPSMLEAEPIRSIDPDSLDGGALYRLCTSLVVPRPIAWVSTISSEGQPNLAPFSFFNAVSDQPAVLMLSIGARRDREKDTLRNIRQTRCLAVHVVDERLAGAMNITATDYPAGTNEFEAAALAAVPSSRIAAPRLRDAAACLECELLKLIPVPGTTFTMVLGQVVMLHVQERCLGPSGTASAEALRPVGKLALNDYTRLGEMFELVRPTLG
ncbi:flavin reductase family protein [Cyanobium sp. ATX 6F1]|uniref:flavin reductase family protein n=1 Tax=unclassified Cyanobium TaxID=2627006 RepID=UPI0020CD004E|nr:flavin reductase family protein [Cyanobium sp. ATX 6F1]MCP9915358.1 flavin reductase family protein [Cyanobium sp. ATX 6F1]